MGSRCFSSNHKPAKILLAQGINVVQLATPHSERVGVGAEIKIAIRQVDMLGVQLYLQNKEKGCLKSSCDRSKEAETRMFFSKPSCHKSTRRSTDYCSRYLQTANTAYSSQTSIYLQKYYCPCTSYLWWAGEHRGRVILRCCWASR